jgi:hypothetical protein
MAFTVRGQTRLPTGRSRRAELTWLSPEERTNSQLAMDRPVVGDADLCAWMFRQQALGAHFAVAPLVETVALDVDDPVSVLAAVRAAFEQGVYELSGDPPEIEGLLHVPKGAIP